MAVTTNAPVQCLACARLHITSTDDPLSSSERTAIRSCDAFPDGIPLEIRAFGVDHRSEFRGDGGKQFLQKPGKDAEKAFEDWNETFGIAAG